MSRSSFVKRVTEMWSAWWAAHWLPPHERSTWAMPIAGRYLVWIFDVETLCPTSLGRRWLAERHRLGDNVVVNGVNWTVRIADEIGCQCLRCLGRRNLVPTPASNTETRSASPLHIAAEVTTPTSPARPGFTLVEMLVVLTILAVLAAVAVTAVEGVGEQARFEATQNTLNNIRTAIVGDASLKNSDGTRLLSGFVVDMGRLPTTLEELIQQPVGTSNYITTRFNSDRGPSPYTDPIVSPDPTLANDVAASGGWNGPYLRLSPSQTDFRDSWGRLFLLPEPAGTAITSVVSLGADGVLGATSSAFDEDLEVAFNAADYQGTVTFSLFENISTSTRPTPTGTQKLGVFLYAPNGTTGAPAETLLNVPFPPHPSNPTYSQLIDYEHTTARFMGPFACRAILWEDGDGDNAVDNGETVARFSHVKYGKLTPGTAGLRMELEMSLTP